MKHKTKGIMTKLRFFSLAAAFTLSALALTSCDDNDCDWDYSRLPTALVTVYPEETGFFLQLDDRTRLVPTNMTASPYGDKVVRALVNFTEQEKTGDDVRNVHINWIDSIRTKKPVVSVGEEDNAVYGNDPVEIIRDWVTVAEDGFLTLRFRTIWGGTQTHVVNLLSGVNPDNPLEFTLKHNAAGDTMGSMGDALIAFDLNDILKEHEDEVTIKLNWTSFSGPKSTEFKLKKHQSQSIATSERLPMSRYVE